MHELGDLIPIDAFKKSPRDFAIIAKLTFIVSMGYLIGSMIGDGNIPSLSGNPSIDIIGLLLGIPVYVIICFYCTNRAFPNKLSDKKVTSEF